MLQPCVFQIFVVPLQAEKETNKTMRHKIFVILGMVVLFAACGVKKPMVVQDEKDEFALKGQIIESNADTFEASSVLGLLWEKDTLFVTLNNGHQLGQAKIVSDTLILHEASRDTTDNATRHYAIHIPMQEMFVIKYNDSLTYPVMPTAVLCEYPLDIKAVDQLDTKVVLPSNLNFPDIPEQFLAGTYLFGQEERIWSIQITDSLLQMDIYPDGTWIQYKDNQLLNAGIVRKDKRVNGYALYNYQNKEILLIDTMPIAGHIHEQRYSKFLRSLPSEELALYKDEYHSIDSLITMSSFALYPLLPFQLPMQDRVIVKSTMNKANYRCYEMIYEGSIYGWKRKLNTTSK